MDATLARYSPQIYAVMRLVVGLAFAQHGAQKLFGVLGGTRVPLLSLLGLAGTIELAGGLLVAVGLFAGWAGFVCSGLMAAAYFKAHAPGGFWPAQNGGELAVLFCFVFLYVAATGNGVWSLGGSRRHRVR